ncbi:MAG: hypothetical protein GYB65_09720, partial [Chloroflexi bacterium]|nr:hypothetical protein [Chloroflexota bacterium]
MRNASFQTILVIIVAGAVVIGGGWLAINYLFPDQHVACADGDVELPVSLARARSSW